MRSGPSNPPDERLPPIAFVDHRALLPSARLGFVAAPGTWRGGDAGEARRSLREDLAALRTCGVGVLVTLLEDAELDGLGLAELFEEARRAGLETRRLPVPDHAAPTDLPAAEALVTRLLDDLARGLTVVVHCRAGMGRSATIVACCLVAAGVAPSAALAAVREAREGAAPGLDAFVEAFADAWGGLSPPALRGSRPR